MPQDVVVSMAATGPRTTPGPLYGGASTGRRVTVRDIAAAKARGEKWPMLTAYDALTAGIFDRAGIPVLLVGDSAAMVVYGHDSTIPVTVDDLIPLTAAVVRCTSRALVVADLPFGSYQASQGAALAAATSSSTWRATRSPPSSLTACAPVSFRKRVAVASAAPGEAW